MVKSKSDKIRHFTDLEAWKKNHELVLEVYELTKKLPVYEKFGIISQLRRSVSSITANIAEGWGRYHYADKIRFYYQARGSSAEVQNFLILAKDLGYIKTAKYKTLIEKATNGFMILSGLIRSTEKQK